MVHSTYFGLLVYLSSQPTAVAYAEGAAAARVQLFPAAADTIHPLARFGACAASYHEGMAWNDILCRGPSGLRNDCLLRLLVVVGVLDIVGLGHGIIHLELMEYQKKNARENSLSLSRQFRCHRKVRSCKKLSKSLSLHLSI